ncbi:MAG TPA: mechanosensitive ion channel protein MscS, partial [Massilia sp.]|nr:mechanosensitive ion channel protein MscS [Massilia sp.]
MCAAVRLLVFLSIFFFSALGQAQDAVPATPAQPVAVATAELNVGARNIFVFRSSLAGFPAQDRAD